MRPLEFLTDEEMAFQLSLEEVICRPTLKEAHLSDIHFGAMDAKVQYQILTEQFLDKVKLLELDIISINGDLFDHKFMTSSDVVMYATMFVRDILDYCRSTGCTFVIIAGTLYHDANQLKIFYQFLSDTTVDIRIVEQVQFEYIKGAKYLCIPELYGQPKEYYDEFLFNSGVYDGVFMHGTLKGAIYGTYDSEKHSDKAPIFDMSDFRMCRGPIISGHVHDPGCFHSYFYYCGSPYTWKFGEAEKKGFFLLLHNLETGEHYNYFEEIHSFVYRTVNLDYMLMKDPKEVIDYIEELHNLGIDYLRVEFNKDDMNDIETSNLAVINKYYSNNSNIKINKKNKKKEVLEKNTKEMDDKFSEYEFINDKGLDSFDKFAKYVNLKKGYIYTTSEEVKKFFENDL